MNTTLPHQRVATLMGVVTTTLSLFALCTQGAAQAKRTSSSTPKNRQKSAPKQTVLKTSLVRPDTPLNRRLQQMEAEAGRRYQQLSDTMRRQVEAELRNWKRSTSHDHLPQASLLSTETKLTGTWSHSTGFDSATFYFLPAQGATIPLYLVTGGCTGLWELKRTARYENGVVTLSRPIKTYPSLCYDQLYRLRVGEKEYLVPDMCVEEFQKALSSDGKSVNEERVSSFAFKLEQR